MGITIMSIKDRIARMVGPFDWLTRGDFVVSFFFDWRTWLWALVPSGGGMTFLWAAIGGRSPLDVWIAATIVMAALAAFVYFVISSVNKIQAGRSGGTSKAEEAATPDTWAERETLEIYVIAYLSVGKPSRIPINKEPELSRHRFLKDAIRDGYLQPSDTNEPGLNVMTTVRRESLRKFAKDRDVPWLKDFIAKWDQLNPPKNEFVSLKEAARSLYEKLRGTDIGSQIEQFDSPNSTPETILESAANYILVETEIWVKRPPSEMWEPLPESKKAQLMVCDGANGLKYLDDKIATYTEPRLKNIDLARIIEGYKKEAKSL
jgi:hypothetical protein